MAYVIPSIRMAPRPAYTPRTGGRTASTSTAVSSGAKPDFQTLLNKQPTAAPAAAATSASTTTTTTTTTPATPVHTIGSIMLGGAVFNPVVTEPAMAPSAQSLFGPNPWITTAGGTGPAGSYSYNKYYFATPETAAQVAQMLGGKVVAKNDLTPYGPFVQNDANQMVQMPDGRLINAGIIASYYDRGWSQQSVDALVKGEIGNINPVPQT